MISFRKIALVIIVASFVWFQTAQPAQAQVLDTVVAWLLDQLVTIETAEKVLDEASEQAEIEADAEYNAKTINYFVQLAKAIGPPGARKDGTVNLEDKAVIEAEKNSYLGWFKTVLGLLNIASNEDLKTLASQPLPLSPAQLSEVKTRIFSGAGTQKDVDLYIHNMGIQVAQPLYKLKNPVPAYTQISATSMTSAQKNNMAIKRLLQNSQVANPRRSPAQLEAMDVSYPVAAIPSNQEEELRKVAEGMAELIRLYDYMEQNGTPLQQASYKSAPAPAPAKANGEISTDQTSFRVAQEGFGSNEDIDCTPREFEGGETTSNFNPLDCLPSVLLSLGDIGTGIGDVDLGCLGTLNSPSTYSSLGSYWSSCGLGMDFDLGDPTLPIKIPNCPINLSNIEDINLNKVFVGGPGYLNDIVEQVGEQIIDNPNKDVVPFPDMHQVMLDAKQGYMYDFYLPPGCNALATPEDRAQLAYRRFQHQQDASAEAGIYTRTYRPAVTRQIFMNLLGSSSARWDRTKNLRSDIYELHRDMDAMKFYMHAIWETNLKMLELQEAAFGVNNANLEGKPNDSKDAKDAPVAPAAAKAADLDKGDSFAIPLTLQNDPQLQPYMQQQSCQTPFSTSDASP